MDWNRRRKFSDVAVRKFLLARDANICAVAILAAGDRHKCVCTFYRLWFKLVLISSSIMYYAVFLFQQAGIGGTQASLLANGIEGVVLNVFVWINMWYIDIWGRRRPMIIGAIGMAISMMLIGVIMKTEGMLLPSLYPLRPLG